MSVAEHKQTATSLGGGRTVAAPARSRFVMLPWIFAQGDWNVSWYVLPLAAAISLVYSASRYELPERILRRAARLFVTIVGCMAALFVVLYVLSYGL
jgi:hypothetical protein